MGSLAYSSIFPSTSVMINWHNCNLAAVKESFLVDAAVRRNPKLKLSPKVHCSAVHAVTRLDLSNNQLVELPESVWSMQSLKSLNLAQNKLESLPAAVAAPKRIGLSSLRLAGRGPLYNCPALEEVFLQDNRLQTLPAALFLGLKALTCLDVSNNKLQYLPFEMWHATALKEFNLSFNLLTELPSSRGGSLGVDNAAAHNNSSLSDTSYDSDISETIPDLNLDSSDTDSVGRAGAKVSQSERDRNLKRLSLKHDSLWSTSLDIQDKSAVIIDEDGVGDGAGEADCCNLVNLNLAHNSFSVVPKCLACLCPSLTRLNLSYNAVSKFGAVHCYPLSLKYLDLSYNEVSDWPGDGPALRVVTP